jgi:hypothetical protein
MKTKFPKPPKEVIKVALASVERAKALNAQGLLMIVTTSKRDPQWHGPHVAQGYIEHGMAYFNGEVCDPHAERASELTPIPAGCIRVCVADEFKLRNYDIAIPVLEGRPSCLTVLQGEIADHIATTAPCEDSDFWIGRAFAVHVAIAVVFSRLEAGLGGPSPSSIDNAIHTLACVRSDMLDVGQPVDMLDCVMAWMQVDA